MESQYYLVREVRNVLFAHLVSPRLAATQFGGAGGIVLSSPHDLQELAIHRRKLLHLTGLPLGMRPVRDAVSVPA